MNLIHAVFEPKGAGPHPTLLALHGWGANALDLLALAPYLCRGRFLVICPQGPLEVPIGAAAVGYGWFPLTEGGPLDMPAVTSAGGKLGAFVKEALERYRVDARKLVVLGFSQGGVLACWLALSEPGRFAALVSLSSWLPAELVEALPVTADCGNLPTLVQHGSRDQLIAVERGRRSVETLRTLRVPVTYREYDMGHEISQKSFADLSSWLEEKVLSPILIAR